MDDLPVVEGSGDILVLVEEDLLLVVVGVGECEDAGGPGVYGEVPPQGAGQVPGVDLQTLPVPVVEGLEHYSTCVNYVQSSCTEQYRCTELVISHLELWRHVYEVVCGILIQVGNVLQIL